jgi:hypothetical protein
MTREREHSRLYMRKLQAFLRGEKLKDDRKRTREIIRQQKLCTQW